jgi:hypothetical protein
VKKFVLPALLIGSALSGAITAEAQSSYEPYSFTTLAGVAPGSTNGTGSAARFFFPNSVALDNAGNVYVADSGNSTIRKITPSGVVSTLAGLTGSTGSADGTGNAARFFQPAGVAVDSAGNVYVADSGNYTIRKITPCGVVSTLAGLAGGLGSDDGTGSAARFNFPYGVAVDHAGNVYVADTNNHTIRKITPSGVVSTLAGLAGSIGSADGTGNAARFFQPYGVAVDSAGNVFVTDTSNNTIRKISPSAVVSTLAGLAGSRGSANGTGSAARFNHPSGVAMDSAGNVFVADTINNTIRQITPSAVVSTLAGLAGSFAGVDGTGSAASFSFPHGPAVDSTGNVYVADSGNNTIRKITPSAVVTTLAGVAGSAGSTDGTGNAARFFQPADAAVDAAGNVYVADSSNSTIRKITPSAVVSTLAGLALNSGSADGTGNAARFFQPYGVAADSAGNVYVADTNNNTIRKITPSAVVSTFAGLAGNSGSADGTGNAARFFQPTSVAVDSAGNVYVADSINNTIRKITPSAVVSTLAGLAGSSGSADGTGSAARFNDPFGVAVDSAGNVYVADALNNTIRKITQAGVVSTLAGVAGSRGSADGTGSAASFSFPQGVAVDSAGSVFVADTLNSTIRVGSKVPPVITTIGQSFVYQLETNGATSFTVSNLPPGLSFDAQLSAILGVPAATGTFQTVISATNPGGTTNSTLTITVQPVPASGPIVASSTSATGRVGRPFSFQVYATNATSAATLSASGLPPGLSIDPVTGIISGSAAAEGSSIVTLAITDGSFAAIATLQLTFTADPALPVIISLGSVSLTPGELFTYTINVPAVCDPSDATTFARIGTLPVGLTFNAAAGTISGIYTGPLGAGANGGRRQPELAGGTLLGSIQLFGTNSHGTSTFQLLFLPASSGAVNISTRLRIETDANVLIAGFIITGNAPKVVVVRALGPSTGIPGVLQDPTLELHDSAGHVVFNDNWRDTETQEAQLQGTTYQPHDDRESAILIGLDPGNYTAIVAGKNGATGIGLVEVYDLGTASLNSSDNAKLANISTRGFVSTGNNVMIGGFIIRRLATRIIVRAIGPELNGSVPGALQDTTLELHNGDGSLIASNDDWRSDQEKEIIATTVPPTDNRESAIVATVDPGLYTGIVRGKNNTTGVALVEIYALE